MRARSGMNGYELCDHLSERFFMAIGGFFPNFYSSVGSISGEIDSQQASSRPFICPILRTRYFILNSLNEIYLGNQLTNSVKAWSKLWGI